MLERKYDFDSSKSLMVVGKATAGWDGEDKDEAEEFVMKCVVRGAYTSSFWHFIHDLLFKIHDLDTSNRSNREEVFEQVVWSKYYEDWHRWRQSQSFSPQVSTRKMY